MNNMIEITDSSFFDNYKCTNITCPNCGAKGDDKITVNEITYTADDAWPEVQYVCFKYGYWFIEPMNYDVEEVIIKKKIYHMKNQREFAPE